MPWLRDRPALEALPAPGRREELPRHERLEDVRQGVAVVGPFPVDWHGGVPVRGDGGTRRECQKRPLGEKKQQRPSETGRGEAAHGR